MSDIHYGHQLRCLDALSTQRNEHYSRKSSAEDRVCFLFKQFLFLSLCDAPTVGLLIYLIGYCFRIPPLHKFQSSTWHITLARSIKNLAFLDIHCLESYVVLLRYAFWKRTVSPAVRIPIISHAPLNDIENHTYFDTSLVV